MGRRLSEKGYRTLCEHSILDALAEKCAEVNQWVFDAELYCLARAKLDEHFKSIQGGREAQGVDSDLEVAYLMQSAEKLANKGKIQRRCFRLRDTAHTRDGPYREHYALIAETKEDEPLTAD